MKLIYRLALIVLLVHGTVFAQEKVLDKVVNVIYREETLKNILDDISKRFDVNISYSSNHVPLQKKVSVNLENVTLAEALETILEGTGVNYVEVGSQIVLKKVKKSSSQKETPKGKSQVAQPDMKVADADVNLEPKVVFFKENEFPKIETIEELKEETVKEQTKIYNEFFAVQDTAKFESGKALKKDLKTALNLLKSKISQVADSIKFRNKNNSLPEDSSETMVSTEASQEYSLPGDSSQKEKSKLSKALFEGDSLIEKPGQVTFFYPLGTNGVPSYKYSNQFSLNVLAGFNGEVNDGAEIGSLVNVVKGEMRGFQASGLVNIVGKDVTGFQAAGISNINARSTKGAQFAGIANITGDTSAVFQGAGIVNFNRGTNIGGQASGITNLSYGSVIGPQVTGIANLVYGNCKTFQGAGIINVTSKNMVGVQVAGIGNFASKITGVQIAGILNTAGKVNGSQIGLINIADSVSGAQIGFLSFSRQGYLRFEFSGTEKLYPSIAMKTGTRDFYNILTVGMGPVNGMDNDWFWWYGYGIGTERRLSGRIPLNIDLVANYVTSTEYNKSHRYFNMLNQLRITAGFDIAKRFSLFAGPVLNVQVSSMPENLYDQEYALAPYKMWEHKFDRVEKEYPTFLSAWVGFTAGIRI